MSYRKIHVLGELHSTMGYSVVGCKFNANQSTVFIKEGVIKQKHT